MKLFPSSQDLETILKESLFCTRRFSTIFFTRTSNTLLVTIVPLSWLHPSQAQLKEKLRLLLNLYFQEPVLDHSCLWLLQKRLPNFVSSLTSLLVSVSSTEISERVVLVLNLSLTSSIIQLDHSWLISTTKLLKSWSNQTNIPCSSTLSINLKTQVHLNKLTISNKSSLTKDNILSISSSSNLTFKSPNKTSKTSNKNINRKLPN